MMPQAIAAMSLKVFMPRMLARFGYRAVLVSNTVMLGLLIVLFATIGAATPVWLIVLQAFCLRVLSVAAVHQHEHAGVRRCGRRRAGSASTIASTAQQLSMSFGVAAASLVAAMFVPDRFHTSPAQMIHGVHQAFLVLGAATIVSTVVFRSLRRGDGSAISQHRDAAEATAAGSRAALANVQPPSQ